MQKNVTVPAPVPVHASGMADKPVVAQPMRPRRKAAEKFRRNMAELISSDSL